MCSRLTIGEHVQRGAHWVSHVKVFRHLPQPLQTASERLNSWTVCVKHSEPSMRRRALKSRWRVPKWVWRKLLEEKNSLQITEHFYSWPAHRASHQIWMEVTAFIYWDTVYGRLVERLEAPFLKRKTFLVLNLILSLEDKSPFKGILTLFVFAILFFFCLNIFYFDFYWAHCQLRRS